MGFKPRPLADRLAEALIAPAKLERLLDDEVVLRVWGWRGASVVRSRKPVGERLAAEANGWLEPSVEVISVTADRKRLVVELRIIAGPGAARLAHNRCVIITPPGSRITRLEMYCGEPVPYGPPAEHIAPATLSDDEISRLLGRSPLRARSRAP